MDSNIGVLKKTVLILNYISIKSEASGVSELSKSLDMPKATIHRILNSLTKYNVVLRTEDGHYRMGPTVMLWNSGFHLPSEIVEMAQPWLNKLCCESRETVHLSVYENGVAHYAKREDSPQTVVLRWSRLGMALPLYCTAAGRAILMSLPVEELNSYFACTKLEARTELTVTSPTKLKKLLSHFRLQGYAEENEENEENIRCVGAAILNKNGYPVAAISLTAPTFRFTDKDAAKYGVKVAESAKEISNLMGLP